jgi:hypothetical protein
MLLARRFAAQALGLGVAQRHVRLPEVIVEVEVEQGAVHVKQDGVDLPPVEVRAEVRA